MASTATALTIVERVEQSAVIAALDARATALMDLLPDEAAVARFRRGVVLAVTKNPDLMNCTPQSIVMACFEAASQGLEPTGAAGGAHLVPYKQKDGTKTAQLIPDYRGVIRLVTKPGSDVVSIEARVVKEGDEFAYQLGTDAFVNHVPSLAGDRSTHATTHVYAIARLKGGAAIPDVEDRAGIERIRKRGANAAQSPWVTDWDEMAKKTLIKRLAKVLPVRPDVRAILSREDELAGEADADPSIPALPAGPTAAARLASRLRPGPRNVTPASEAPGAADPFDPPTGTGATDAAAADPGAAADAAPWASSDAEPGLVEKLRTNAEASGLVGAATAPQKEQLAALFTGLDWPSETLPVLVDVFGPATAKSLTAAQAQALISLAGSMGDDAFLAEWVGLK